MPKAITAETVAAEARAGRFLLTVAKDVPVTPAAWTKARELGVTIDRSGTVPKQKRGASKVATPGGFEHSTDVSGVKVVRGGSVALGRFDGAGPGKHVGLVDVVTAKDGSPMAAGFMEWSREDSFPWKLDYDEVDYVLEGVLHVTIGGHVVEARAGDVVYIPKGSAITFGTPRHVKLFYVTFPAEWSAPPK